MPVITQAQAWGMMWKDVRDSLETKMTNPGDPRNAELLRLCDTMALTGAGAIPVEASEQKIEECAVQAGVSPDEFRRKVVDDLFGRA